MSVWPGTATPLTDAPPRGTLRVWWISQDSCRPSHVAVASVGEAKRALTAQVRYDLLACGLEVFDGDGWFEWDDEDGNSLGDLML